ncbi:MAG: ribonuclease D [Pelagibacteraceae bacterium TMED237]|nr:MAG: ribonuclease D [Pelagibacteraceae bacterium TMED237]|tara:strand:- start:13183 stop:13791 length:609 start_codon:yes stop_codon:yes gene_type:complete
MKINIYKGDLPKSIKISNSIAIDSETMGLNPKRDKLCLIQLSNGDEICHLVKIDLSSKKPVNLIKILKNNKIQKIFHYARFDVAVFKHNFNINIKNIYCTKIASKLVRTYTDKHGYKDLCSELLNKNISKTEQSSDWGGELSKNQQKYAATDVLYLHKIKDKLDKLLLREKRSKLAKACFDFIEYRTELDINGWADTDIFKH